MEYEIYNEVLKAKIDSYGAQLKKLISKDNLNRLHEPNNETWNEVSPVLFPQISRMKGYVYHVNEIEYTMPLHGFLKKKELQVVEQKTNKIVFYLCDDEETLKCYPYKFEIYVCFEIIDNLLDVSFKINNTGNEVLRYMIGGHPGFKVPLFEKEQYEDYYLKFPFKETIEAMQVVDGFLANVYKPFLNNEDTINLKHELFYNDAIVMKKLKSPYVDIMSKTNDKITRFHFSDFEILAVWSLNTPKANYVCLEPWNGIQKDFVIDHEKMGILELESNKSSIYSYKIEIIK